MTTHLGKWVACSLTALILGIAPSSSKGDFLLGVSYTGGQLISIDTTTGSGSRIGSLDKGVSPYGLASNAGRLYTFDVAANTIRQINPVSGAIQASIKIGVDPSVGQGGLAFRHDGVGFLTTVLDPANLNVLNDLYSFNLAAGTSKLIGHTGPTLAGLAFVGNVLYGLGKLDNTLYRVDTTSGATTVVGNLFANPNDPSAALGSPIESLTAGPGGLLYATLDDRLFTINSSTGLARSVDPDPLNSIGFSSISGITLVSVVPEPASFLLVGVGLASAVVVSRSRRRP